MTHSPTHLLLPDCGSESQTGTTERYSILELLKHDESARAPERDFDTTAFELDASRLAPEVCPETTPQVFYRNSLPEANHQEKSPLDPAQTQSVKKRQWKWVAIGVILVVLVAVGIGVGVGLWRARKESSHQPPTVNPIQTASAPHSPIPTPTIETILNDTSLAATILANGDRHVYFQDSAGLIRWATYSSSGQWLVSPKSNISSNPQDHTPLAATAVERLDGTVDFQVFYVGQDQWLRRSYLSGGIWLADQTLSNYTAKAGTRHLSITSISKESTIYDTPGNSTVGAALLYFENSKGTITALINVFGPPQILDLIPTVDGWMDVSSHTVTPGKRSIPHVSGSDPDTTLYESFSLSLLDDDEGPPFTAGEFIPVNGDNLNVAGSMYGTPFTCGPVVSKGVDNLAVNAIFYAGEGDPDSTYGGKYSRGHKASFLTFTAYHWDNDSNLHHGIFYSDGGHGGLNLIWPDNATNPLIQSDLALIAPAGFGIWVNGTQPTSFNYRGVGPSNFPMPGGAFPFARLASIAETDGSRSYLYHQLNGTTIVEEQWNQAESNWITPIFITIPE